MDNLVRKIELPLAKRVVEKAGLYIVPENRIKELVFDMSGVEYISSAGIRVLLGVYKKINSHQGTMRIEKANEQVYEVFEMTGLSDMLE